MKTRNLSPCGALILPLFGLAVAAAVAAPVSAQRTVGLPDRDKALAGAPQTLFTVGKEEGDTPDVFAGVNGVAFDKVGNLYVLDRDNAHVVVFGPGGRVLRAVGQKGEGPGELALPLSMAVLPDGRLAIMDAGNGAISLFGVDGEYQDLVHRNSGGGMMLGLGGGAMAGHASGGLVMTGSQLVGGGPGGGLPQARDSVPILLQPLTGEAKVLFNAPAAAPVIRGSGGGGRQEVQISGPATFAPRVMWAVLPDGRLAVSYGQDYGVNIVASTGGTVASVLERPLKARKVTEKDKDAAREARRQALTSGAGMMMVQNVNGRTATRVGGAGLPAAQVEQMLARMTFAETMPVIRNLRADPDNRIWVQRDAGSGSTDYPIDILAAGGSYLGTVKDMPLPDAIGPGGLLAFIETDDLGVQRVSVKRAPAAWFR